MPYLPRDDRGKPSYANSIPGEAFEMEVEIPRGR